MNNIAYSIFAAFSEDRYRTVRGLPAWRFHRVNAPYALMPLGNNPHVLLPVNRQYSPLGVDCEDYVRYEPYASQAIHFREDPFWESGIWFPQPPYLFRYNPATKGDYVARLLKLASLAVSPVEAKIKLGLEDGGAA